MTDIKPSINWTEGFIKTHERLIAIVFVLAALLLGANWVLNWRASVDKQKAAEDQSALQIVRQQVEQIDQRNQQQMETLKQLVGQVSAQNSVLATAIVSRNQQVQVQQKTDAGLPPTQLSGRWEELIGTVGQVTPDSGGYQVAPQAAVVTTQQLEEVPVLKQNIADLTIQSDGKDKIIAQGKDFIQGQTAEISGLKDQSLQQDKTCKAEIASVKAEARKLKFKWGMIGIVIGMAAKALGI